CSGCSVHRSSPKDSYPRSESPDGGRSGQRMSSPTPTLPVFRSDPGCRRGTDRRPKSYVDMCAVPLPLPLSRLTPIAEGRRGCALVKICWPVVVHERPDECHETRGVRLRQKMRRLRLPVNDAGADDSGSDCAHHLERYPAAVAQQQVNRTIDGVEMLE